MTKTLTYVFAGLIAVGGITAFATDQLRSASDSNFSSRQQVRKPRAERPVRKGAPSKAIARVMGGTNGDRQLYGVHIYNEYTGDAAGVTSIGDNGRYTYLKRISDPVFSGCYMGDKLLVVAYDPWSENEDYSATYTYYNTDTWAVESSVKYGGDVPDIVPYGMAYDHTTNLVYSGFFKDSSNSMFASDAQLGYLTGDADTPVHIVGELPERMRAMAVDESGTLYGLSFKGTLYSINKNTAAATVVTKINLPVATDDVSITFPYLSYGRESMTVDWETGLFYISYSDNDGYESYISRFSKDGSVSEMLVDYGYENGPDTQHCFTALFFKQDYSKPGVTTPSVVTDLSIKPLDTQLKAEVSFTLPSLATDNTTLSGNVDWTVTDGENELAKGQGQAGSQVNVTVDVAQAGNATFVVFASIDGNQSRGVSQTLYVGPDVPVISSRPTVRANGNTATVRWNAATAANGAAMEPVTYRVVRQPDGVVVAEATAETSLVDEIASEYKTCYVYDVTPVAGPMTGETVSSRGEWMGTYFAMPHTNDFTDEGLFLQYDVIDNNKDNNIWDINLSRKAATYHGNSNKADDYLLVGPFKMSAGNTYTFHMTADGHNISERVAVYIGTDASNVNSFKTVVVPPTDVYPMEGVLSVNRPFEPETDGTYWYAIHACSDANSQYLYIYDVAVREINGSCPAAPSGFDVVPGADSAVLRFTLPTTNIDGSDCASISEVRIYRENVLIDAISSEDVTLTPGDGFEYIDTDEIPDGTYRYSVAVVNAAGEGRTAEFSLYRGLDYPGAPRNLRIWEDPETSGLMHVTFDAPERGYYGGYIDAAAIDYTLDYMMLNGASAELSLGKGGEHTFQLPDALTAQDGFAGNVYGTNSRGNIRGNWATAVCIVGPAMNLPVQESWSELTQRSGLWIGQDIDAGAVSGTCSWTITDGTHDSILPQDGDGGELLANTLVENGARRIMSPRFTIGEAARPMLVFYYLFTPDAADFLVEAIVDNQPVRTIATPAMDAGNAGKWIRCQVPLDEFKSSKYMQIAFTGRGKTPGTFLGLDNVTISDYVEHDLAVKEFTAPSRGDINQDLTFTLRIRNNGGLAVAAGDYTVELVKNGETVAAASGEAVDASAEVEYLFTDIPVVTDPASSEYSARIVYADDENMTNNASRTVAVRIVTPAYPTVSDLTGEYTEDGILLSWSDPGTSDMPGTPTIESFETYPDFAISNIGDWTLYDRDDRPTVIMALATGVLSYDHIGEHMAWQVMDPTTAGIPLASWTPRTGDHMLVSFQACVDGARNVDSEDWLVSPELNGSEQNISFYARAGMSAYSPEIFDFMVSSTGNNVEDFTALASDVEVPYTAGEDWTEFVYKVPAGTRYFAIVHKTFNRLALLVDDITYVRAGSSPVTLELQGYNVYRDGKLMNFSPVTDNEYVDSDVEEGNDYTYALTTLWDKGESGLSESVTVRASSGVGAVDAHDIRITAAEGAIRIEGGRGETVAVYSMDGICVASAVADGMLTVPVSTGFYVVRAGDAVVRVAVR